MNETEVIEICRQAVVVMLKVGGPLLLTGLVTGVLISLVQTLTQIQEMTLTFIPKILMVFAVTMLLFPFMIATLSSFAHALADRIVQIGLSG